MYYRPTQTPGRLISISYIQPPMHTSTKCSVQAALSRGGHILLALHQHLHLLAHLAQSRKHLLVAVDESKDLVLDPSLRAELLDERLQLAEIVSRHAREEMMYGLELQTPVDEVEPCWAIHVHSGAELSLGKRLCVT